MYSLVFQEIVRTPGIIFTCIGHVSSIFCFGFVGCSLFGGRFVVLFVAVVSCLISGTWIS